MSRPIFTRPDESDAKLMKVSDRLLADRVATPAAIIGRLLIERQVCRLLTKHGIKIKGDSKVARALKKFREDKIIGEVEYRDLRLAYDIGCHASHGGCPRFDRVRAMMRTVRWFLKVPAAVQLILPAA